MIVVVCGSRDWADPELIASRLSALPGEHENITIVHGACSRKVAGREVGADMLADAVARALGFTVEQYPADWQRHGAAAGPIRNRQMLNRDPAVDLALAFHRAGSRGTAGTIAEARRRGIDVEVHEA